MANLRTALDVSGGHVVRLENGEWLYLLPRIVPCSNCDGGQCMDCVCRYGHDDCYESACPICEGSGEVWAFVAYGQDDLLQANQLERVHYRG